ncbi:hypothetical protein M2447_001114 [Ereboglobus sp. PH5-10]|uniref:hypothetical protein n=1 Tax=Ereboglobus sp. PH5-10 TaxID=2940629 RepID=UPI0024075D0F|nr:hypothetical protein [Ereboglobus sp. PH5-10]MDF9827025.1 hypothetical protein [Ereboglobus sp. PH5-10]
MSLREQIEQRRMAQSANGSTVSAKPEKSETQQSEGATFLRLVKLSKQCWVLPWGSFHGAGFTPADAAGNDASKYDRLHLVFSRHEVAVRGYNLVGVVNAVEMTSLRELCETTEKYTDATTPVILAVEINVKIQ